MFKFCLYAAMCVSLVYYSVAASVNPCLEGLGEGEYAIYSREDVISEFVTRRVNSGIGFIYFCDSSDAALVRGEFNSIDGESIVVKGKTAREVFSRLGYGEVSSSGNIYYGYSPRGSAFIKSGGRKINLQVVERAGSVVVGWPVILGSY